MGLFSSKPSKEKSESNKGPAVGSGEPQPEKPKSKRDIIADKYRQMDERSRAIEEQMKWLESFNRRKYTGRQD